MTLNTGRCATDGVNSFVRVLGSRSWPNKTNYRSALPGEKSGSWSLLLAYTSNRARFEGFRKGRVKETGLQRPLSFWGLVSQPLDCLSRHSKHRPLTHRYSTQFFVEANRGFVPIEHGPFKSPAVPLARELCQIHQHRAAPYDANYAKWGASRII